MHAHNGENLKQRSSIREVRYSRYRPGEVECGEVGEEGIELLLLRVDRHLEEVFEPASLEQRVYASQVSEERQSRVSGVDTRSGRRERKKQVGMDVRSRLATTAPGTDAPCQALPCTSACSSPSP